MMYTVNLRDKLLHHLEQELPFVVYRKPEESGQGPGGGIKAMLQKDREKYLVKDFGETGFVFAPFDSSKETILIPTSSSQMLQTKSVADFGGIVGPSKEADKEELQATKPTRRERSSDETSLDAKKSHMELVERGLKHLKKGGLDKVVLARSEKVPVHKTPLALFGDLVRAYPKAFVYCWYHPKVGLWLGATPESLVHLQGKRFTTMALAGTQPYAGKIAVEWGLKEQQEQQYVTDTILKNLRQLDLQPQVQPFLGQEQVGVEGTYTSRAGNLLHLRTDITGEVETERTLGKIVRALHPTPAVGGLPKEEAREFILREETHDREFYSGFLGELNLQEARPRSRNRRNVENLAYRTVRKQSCLYVNLRCMKLEEGKAIIFVGGGITADSDPAAEWEETVNKTKTMKRVLL